jgi:ABC-type Fe3+ transport system substrate-binding protein
VAKSTPTPVPGPFDLLIARAKASNDYTIRYALEGTDPDIIEAMEDDFRQRFDIELRLESEPGHSSRDVPLKIIQAAASGKGVVDATSGSAANLFGMMRENALQVPDWDTIYDGYPLARELRELGVPAIGGGPGDTQLSDYCMAEGMTFWTINYNTLHVQPEEVSGIAFEEFTEEKWRNRLAFDARALGFYVFPFRDDWDDERLRIFANNLGANGLKLIPGGSTGVRQAVVQGEGDVGMAGPPSQKLIDDGAPISWAFPEFVPGTHRVACLPKYPSGNQDMATLFFAWNNFDGYYLRSELTGGGFRPYVQEEAEFLPRVKIFFGSGRTEDDLALPQTEADYERTGVVRKIAMDAMNAGIQSGEKITR